MQPDRGWLNCDDLTFEAGLVALAFDTHMCVLVSVCVCARAILSNYDSRTSRLSFGSESLINRINQVLNIRGVHYDRARSIFMHTYAYHCTGM